MPTEWFYQLDGVQVGPMTSVDLKRHAAAGRLESDTLVRRGDNSKWYPAHKVKGLLPELANNDVHFEAAEDNSAYHTESAPQETQNSSDAFYWGEAQSQTESPPPQEHPNASNLIPCPVCGNNDSRRVTDCPRCAPLLPRKEFVPEAGEAQSQTESAPPQEPSKTNNVIPCPDCGKSVSRRATDCPHCGRPLQENAYQESPFGNHAIVNGVCAVCGCSETFIANFHPKCGRQGSPSRSSTTHRPTSRQTQSQAMFITGHDTNDDGNNDLFLVHSFGGKPSREEADAFMLTFIVGLVGACLIWVLKIFLDS